MTESMRKVMCGKCILLLAMAPRVATQTCSFGETVCTTTADCTSSSADTCISGCCKWYGCNTDSDCTSNSAITWDTCDTASNTCTIGSGCSCDQSCQDDYTGKIVGGSAAGAVISIGFTIAASIGCCCGVDCGNPTIPKVIGAVAMLAGAVSIAIPWMASANAANGAVDDLCASCTHECTESEKDSARSVLSSLGFIVAYTIGCGFWSCIFGPIAIGIGGGSVCQCCGPLSKKDADAASFNGAPPPPQAIGVPVKGQNVKSTE